MDPGGKLANAGGCLEVGVDLGGMYLEAPRFLQYWDSLLLLYSRWKDCQAVDVDPDGKLANAGGCLEVGADLGGMYLGVPLLLQYWDSLLLLHHQSQALGSGRQLAKVLDRLLPQTYSVHLLGNLPSWERLNSTLLLLPLVLLLVLLLQLLLQMILIADSGSWLVETGGGEPSWLKVVGLLKYTGNEIHKCSIAYIIFRYWPTNWTLRVIHKNKPALHPFLCNFTS